MATSSQTADHTQCMCMVCSCGQHKCPSSETVHYDAGLLSEYGERFPVWPIAKKAAHKPPSGPNNEGPFYDETTYNVEYAKKALPKRITPKPSCDKENAGPFVDATTYKVDFWDKSKEQRPGKRVETVHKMESGPFYDETTYGEDYGPKRIPTRKHCGKMMDNLGNECAKLEDETTYNVDFKDWKVKTPCRTQTAKDPEPSQPFYSDTTYTVDYKAKSPVKRCPVLLRPKPTKVSDKHHWY